MNSIMQSIRPEWCEMIANGKKKIEVRKTRPKIDPPFKVYMYCTKPKLALLRDENDAEEKFKYDVWEHAEFHEICGKTIFGGKVIGEYICDCLIPISITYSDPNCGTAMNEFPYTCLTDRQIIDCLGNGKQGYGYHISELVIYDKPNDIKQFKHPCTEKSFCEICRYSVNEDTVFSKVSVGCERGIIRPPQSWCYVEELK